MIDGIIKTLEKMPGIDPEHPVPVTTLLYHQGWNIKFTYLITVTVKIFG